MATKIIRHRDNKGKWYYQVQVNGSFKGRFSTLAQAMEKERVLKLAGQVVKNLGL